MTNTTNNEKDHITEDGEASTQALPILDLAQRLPGKEAFSRVFETNGERFILYSIPREAQGSKPFVTDWSIKHWTVGLTKPQVHQFKLDGYKSVEDFLEKEKGLLT